MRLVFIILFILVSTVVYSSYIPRCQTSEDDILCDAKAYLNGTLNIILVNHGRQISNASLGPRCIPDSFDMYQDSTAHLSCFIGVNKAGSSIMERFSLEYLEGMNKKEIPLSISVRVGYGTYRMIVHKAIFALIAFIVMMLLPVMGIYAIFRRFRGRLFLMVFLMSAFSISYMLILLFLLSKLFTM